MLDWDDLRFVLAVSRSGAALGAARALGVNQTTVTRRLAHIEAALGADLFERRQSGYRPTELGQRVADAAATIERTVADLTSDLAARRRVVSGLVRFTCPETIANQVVAPWLGDFFDLHPQVRIEVINTDVLLDIGKGEADVGFRVGQLPTGAGVVARRLPDRLWALYGGRGYVRQHGMPTSNAEIRNFTLVGLEGLMGQLPSAVWFERLVGRDRIPVRCSSLSNVLETLRAGVGLGMLPCSIAEAAPELIRCLPAVPELNAQCWLIVRDELRQTPHIRAFVDFLVARLADEVQDGPTVPLAP